MSDRAAEDIATKQAYLRKHISAEKYEDFGEFCEATAGSIDIENWSVEYVYELVDRFKRSEADKAKNNKKTGAFHLYQTGSDDEIKELASRLKKQQQKEEKNQEKVAKEEHAPPLPPPVEQKPKPTEQLKPKQQKSALDVLDSIFKTQPPEQTKKYDKSFFESCNFWGAPTEEPQIKSKNSPTSSKGKPSPEANKFGTGGFILQPDNFDKMFQTGLALPELKPKEKEKEKEKEKIVKKEQMPIFVEIPIQQDPPLRKIQEPVNRPINMKQTSQPPKKPEIKLVSVKDIASPKNKQSKLPFDGEVLFPKPFKTTVACFKSLERAALSARDLKVEITDHQIINRSFFSADYPMFHLKVLPANIICKRNLEDFQKLRRNLEYVYPGMRLPYLQKLGWLQLQTSPQYIMRQKKYLSYFLEDVLQNNELKNSRLLEDFLTLKDHKQMKRKFQEYDRMKRITSIEELCLLEGEVPIELTQQTRQYNQLLQGFLIKLKAFWGEEERILAQVAQMHASLANSYQELQALIEGMAKDTRDFNRRVSLNQAESMEQSLRSLKEFIAESVKVNQKQARFLEQNMLVYMRYEKENMKMFDPVLLTRNDLTRAYLRRKDAERSNDREQYLSERLQECKTGVLEQSSSITVLKYQCGYINSLVASQGRRYLHLLSATIEQVISDICLSKLEYLGSTITTFTGLVQA